MPPRYPAIPRKEAPKLSPRTCDVDAMVKAAYFEGWFEGTDTRVSSPNPSWENSRAKASLAKTEGR